MEVPFVRGEKREAFFRRRDKMLQAAFENDLRKDTYCTWRGENVSVLVNDARWSLLDKDAVHKTYAHEAIHLHVIKKMCNKCPTCSDATQRYGSASKRDTPCPYAKEEHILTPAADHLSPIICEESLAHFDPQACGEKREA